MPKPYDLIVYSGTILALSASGMVFTVSLFLGEWPPWQLLLTAFLVTYSSYNINRFTDKEDFINHPFRTKFYQENKHVILLSIASYMLALVLCIKASPFATIVIVLQPTLVALYSFKVIPTRRGRTRLKDIELTKNLTVALGWSLFAFLATFFLHKEVSKITLASAMIIFLRFFINAVVFDMRDVRGDKVYHIRTVPISIGAEYTKKFLTAINWTCLLFTIFAVNAGWLPELAYALTPITLYAHYFIEKIVQEKDTQLIHFLCDVIVDGEFIVWALLVGLGKLTFLA